MTYLIKKLECFKKMQMTTERKQFKIKRHTTPNRL